MFAVVTIVALLCFAGTPTVFMQTVGDACSANTDCTITSETCNTKCECAANYINKGSQTCISNDCTADADAAICNGLTNFICVSNVCTCNSISSAVTTAGATKGSCGIKTCSADTDCTGGETNSVCASGSCACKSGYEIKDGVCAVAASGAGMVAASLGALMFTLFLQLYLL